MFGFLLRRLAVLIPTFIGVSIIAFAFIRLLPGDPVALLSGERVMSPERHAQISAQLGMDRPLASYTEDEALRLINAVVTTYVEAMVQEHERSKFASVRMQLGAQPSR